MLDNASGSAAILDIAQQLKNTNTRNKLRFIWFGGEELGLLGTTAARTKGAHRLYSEADIAHLQELIRLRDLLGLSLEDLALAEAEEARAALRNRWAESASHSEHARGSSGQRFRSQRSCARYGNASASSNESDDHDRHDPAWRHPGGEG